MKNFSATRPTIPVDATTESKVITLDDHGCDLLVTNEGDVSVRIVIGSTPDVFADNGGTWITPGSQQVLGVPLGCKYVAICTVSGEASVGLQLGSGS